MIDINVSLFIQMANFLVLLILLNLVLYKPIRTIIQKRRQTMDDWAAEADKLGRQREERSAEYQAEIREAQAEGVERKNELKNQALDQEKALMAKINQEMTAEKAKIADQVKAEVEQARQALLGQVDVFSAAVAEKILGRSFS